MALPCRGCRLGWAGPPPEANGAAALACGIGVTEEVVDRLETRPS